MDEKEKELEKRISISELEDEELDHRLSKAEKKARIRELNKDWGGGAKKVLQWAKSLKVDKETADNLFGNPGHLRDYNNPRNIR